MVRKPILFLLGGLLVVAVLWASYAAMRPALQITALLPEPTEIYLDGKRLGSSRVGEPPIVTPVAPGAHEIRAVTSRGEVVAARVDLRSDALASANMGRFWCVGVARDRSRSDPIGIVRADRATCANIVRLSPLVPDVLHRITAK